MAMSPQLPDFNVMVSLHRQDPEAFESFRRHVLREAIDMAPAAHQPMLERLVARMDEVREQASNPADAAAAAFRLMQQSVRDLREAWVDAQHAMAGLQATVLLHRLRN